MLTWIAADGGARRGRDALSGGAAGGPGADVSGASVVAGDSVVAVVISAPGCADVLLQRHRYGIRDGDG
jgi:hypothetical protein